MNNGIVRCIHANLAVCKRSVEKRGRMNIVVLNGRLFTLPKISFMQISDSKNIMVCKFVLSVKEQKIQYEPINEEDNCIKEHIDFFECIAFEETANLLNHQHFCKGEKIIIRGQVKNFIFNDANRTPHFTNIIVVEQVEYGDADSIDISIAADLERTDAIFKEICKAGFLCVDEDDYYKIATFGML